MALVPSRTRAASLAALALAVSACGGASPPKLAPAGAEPGSPLGPSYVLLPLPSDDDAMLGRILTSAPEPGRAFEEVTRPNPCAEHLGPAKASPMASSFEDAQDVSMNAKAKAVLGTFGFEGEAARATHFVYKLETDKKISRLDTTEYEACCKDKGCGYGYVSALVYGAGEYAAGEETSASAGVEVGVVSASGGGSVKMIKKRKVKGYLAAVVAITDREKLQNLGPLGVTPESLGIKEESDSEVVKAAYEKAKLSVTEQKGGQWAFTDARGTKITENEFIRRYQRVTGSNDLDESLGRRNAGKLVAFGLLTGVGGAALGTGAVVLASGSVVGVVGVVVGLGLTIPFGILTISHATSTAKYDGAVTNHVIQESDAQRLLTKYNRKLLRKTIHDFQKDSSSHYIRPAPLLELKPVIGFGAAGFVGRF